MLLLGLLLAHLSPCLVVFGDSIVRQAVIAAGTAMTLCVIPLSLMTFRLNQRLWIQLTFLAISIGLIEFASQHHLAENDGIEKLPLRLVAYGYLWAGWFLGANKSLEEKSFPIPVQWLAILLSLGAAVVWMQLSISLSAQGSRFTASDDLHPVGLGLVFGVSACVCFGLAFSSEWFTLRLAALPACIALVGCMLTTGSRGSMLALTAAITITAFSQMKTIKSFVGISFLAAGALLIAVAATLFVPEVREQFNYLVERFSRIGVGNDDAALAERTEIRNQYASKLPEWLWLGSEDYDMTRYPHNIFLELFIRFGIVLGGVVAVCLVISSAKALRWMFNGEKAAPNSITLVITLLGLFGLITSQFNLALEFSRVLWMFAGYWLAKPSAPLRLRA